MASIQILKTRIRSVKSTKQITKAMQLVAASKMRRAQEATKVSAPYATAARELLNRLSVHNSVIRHPLFAARPVKSRLIIVIASDKGLAGAYNSNIFSLNQKPKVLRVLPAGANDDAPTGSPAGVTYEPSTEEVLDGVAYRLVSAQVFQALLDARASEHSMRMIAMKNATDNASDLVDDLTLVMNKARQGAITQELAEISGGVEALNQ
jgi:F0F1-type ATP synthase gamma subunit